MLNKHEKVTQETSENKEIQEGQQEVTKEKKEDTLKDTIFVVDTFEGRVNLTAEDIDKALNSDTLSKAIASTNMDDAKKEEIICSQINRYFQEVVLKGKSKADIKEAMIKNNPEVLMTLGALWFKYNILVKFKDAKLLYSTQRFLKLAIAFMILALVTNSGQLLIMQYLQIPFLFGFVYITAKLSFRLAEILMKGE